jgi:15,16-dihydrobiliverdin:ferredoxin oxidoreductase
VDRGTDSHSKGKALGKELFSNKMISRSSLIVATICGIISAFVQAFTPSAKIGSSSFVHRRFGSAVTSSLPSSSDFVFSMDFKTTVQADNARLKLEHLLQKESPSVLDIVSARPACKDSATSRTIDEAVAAVGMPWRESIDRWLSPDGLLYMKFWEWHLSFIKDNLTNLKVEPCTNHDESLNFSYTDNMKKKARIANICLSSNEYRKIRMTYYDAGENTQVFNAVWYPDPKYDLPVLGIDLLAFNRKKYLAIVDFQPLHEEEGKHDAPFEYILAPIKEKYDTLKGRMSSKFYDETQFFSNQMLFARFDDESVIDKELFPAFQSYVKAHVDLLRSTDGDDSPNRQAAVMARQKAYDTYSAERDPAMGLFMAMFGADWAQDFVHEFLFDMSESKGCPPARPMGAVSATPGSGGNPFANGGSSPATFGRHPLPSPA